MRLVGGDHQEVVAEDIRKRGEVGVEVVVKVLEGDQLEEGVAVVVRELCLFYCSMEAVFDNFISLDFPLIGRLLTRQWTMLHGVYWPSAFVEILYHCSTISQPLVRHG
jgi:hypothetical protein